MSSSQTTPLNTRGTANSQSAARRTANDTVTMTPTALEEAYKLRGDIPPKHRTTHSVFRDVNESNRQIIETRQSDAMVNKINLTQFFELLRKNQDIVPGALQRKEMELITQIAHGRLTQANDQKEPSFANSVIDIESGPLRFPTCVAILRSDRGEASGDNPVPICPSKAWEYCNAGYSQALEGWTVGTADINRREAIFEDPYVDEGCYPSETVNCSQMPEAQQIAEDSRCGCMDPDAMEGEGRWNSRLSQVEKKSFRERFSAKARNVVTDISDGGKRRLKSGR